MILPTVQFSAAESSGGISSLGLNLKSFIFQLITFLIVLLILRKWVFPKLVATLEARRQTLEESLAQAKQTQEALEQAEEKAAKLLHKAREEADGVMAQAKQQAKDIAAEGEKTAQQQANRVIADAEAQIAQAKTKLHDELKAELTDLVVATTEKVLSKKLTTDEDRKLVERSIKELA